MNVYTIIRLILGALIIVPLFAFPVLSFQDAEGDTLLKLVIFTPEAKVFDHPNGDLIGSIDRGRVIRLLGSEGRWLNFTAREFSSAWLRWEYTQTLEEWAQNPPFDSIQVSIVAWEHVVRKIDSEIEQSLTAINNIRNDISQGKTSIEAGIGSLRYESEMIEDSFRELHNHQPPEVLQEAAKLLESKRWAIGQGLDYLMKFIYEGSEEDGIAAGKYFQMAEKMMYQYSKQMFQVKSKYNLYETQPDSSE
ncbi:MAG: hypothetical protein H8E46_12625 [FCB group bacterium]|nr:hypothetical protein [FCB group bacterium]